MDYFHFKQTIGSFERSRYLHHRINVGYFFECLVDDNCDGRFVTPSITGFGTREVFSDPCTVFLEVPRETKQKEDLVSGFWQLRGVSKHMLRMISTIPSSPHALHLYIISTWRKLYESVFKYIPAIQTDPSAIVVKGRCFCTPNEAIHTLTLFSQKRMASLQDVLCPPLFFPILLVSYSRSRPILKYIQLSHNLNKQLQILLYIYS